MNKPGARPAGKVSNEWSPELAYAVGLLASDGNLSKDGRHIDFTSTDRELVETFKRCLGLITKIGTKKNGAGGKLAFRTQFGDVLFYRWLVKIGLHPNKSKTLGRLNIPRDLFFDFLRGYFDGDGTIYSYWDPRWHSSFMFYSAFTSASKPFLEWLRDEIEILSGVRGRIEKASGALQLKFAKTTTRTLFARMYYSKTMPHLRRKFTKAEEIFRIDEAHQRE